MTNPSSAEQCRADDESYTLFVPVAGGQAPARLTACATARREGTAHAVHPLSIEAGQALRDWKMRFGRG